MKFSVVGLPHYTIWHLYEPSVDDLRHMEEMEKEKSDKAAKEKADIEKIEKIKSQFHNPSSQWEKDKTTFQDIAVQAGKLYSEKIARKSAEMHPQKGAGPGASKSDKVKAAPADQV